MKPTNILAFMAIAVFGASFALSGCSTNQSKVSDTGKNGTGSTTASNEHSGWWCSEHGVPEEECSMCSTKVAAACKAKGDWCKEHSRAESQCFKCDPKRAERFAALYVAKYGTQPPVITE